MVGNIDVRFHFLHDLVEERSADLIHCGTEEQLSDIMTKPLKLESYLKLRSILGVCELT